MVYFPISGLEAGHRYFFAVTAYNGAGESDYSNELNVVFDPTTAPQVTAGPDQIGSVGQDFWLGAEAEAGLRYVWLQRAGPYVSLRSPTSSRA